MRPTIWTYSLVMAVPAAGPGTSVALLGNGTCCASALVNASAPTSAAAIRFCVRVVFNFVFPFFWLSACLLSLRCDRLQIRFVEVGRRLMPRLALQHGASP